MHTGHDEQVSERHHDLDVPAVDWVHADDLPVDQLDAFVFGEDARLTHPVVLINRQSPGCQLNCHLTFPHTRSSPRLISQVERARDESDHVRRAGS
jgi:hypothetical protein